MEIINQQGKTQKEKKKGKKKWLLLVLFLLLLAGLALFLSRRQKKLEHERLAETGILPTMTAEEIQKRLNAIVEEGMFNVGINGQMQFPSGGGSGNVQIENIAANHYSCTVDLYINETQEKILSTGLIDPGQFIQSMPLKKPPKDGVYDCTAVFSVYDSKSLKEVGKVNVNVIVSVGTS